MTGSLDSHDRLCRFLAAHAAVRVLSAGYRLAPEHPFPAAFDDAAAAYRHAAEHAVTWGADPVSIAVGGDSAGGGLAAAIALQAGPAGGPAPAFLLMFYPHCDTARRSASRDLFGEGFGLTDEDIDWSTDRYLPPGADRTDPRVCIGRADDLSAMPPTYLVTAGFDPLRDEGELFADRLSSAGVAVIARRNPISCTDSRTCWAFPHAAARPLRRPAGHCGPGSRSAGADSRWGGRDRGPVGASPSPDDGDQMKWCPR